MLAKQDLTPRANPSPWFNLGFGQVYCPFFSIFYYRPVYTAPKFVNILSFNLGNPYDPRRTGRVISVVTEDAHQLYMSEKGIYISYSEKGDVTTVVRKIYVYKNYLVPYADVRIKGTL